jgi:hypothetical protein
VEKQGDSTFESSKPLLSASDLHLPLKTLVRSVTVAALKRFAFSTFLRIVHGHDSPTNAVYSEGWFFRKLLELECT